MDRHRHERAEPLTARISIDLNPAEVELGESAMKGVDVEHEIGEEKETDFYPEGIEDDVDNGD